MSAHVLLNLLNTLRKRDKMRGLLDSNYHMTLKILKNHIFSMKNVKILSSFTQRYNVHH